MTIPRHEPFEALASVTLGRLGQACTFTHAAVDTETSCIIDQAVDLRGIDAPATEKLMTITLPVADVGEPVRGDRVQIGLRVWRLEDLVDDDGYTVSMTAKEVTA